MTRLRNCRKFILDVGKSQKIEKLAFILPFIVLLFDLTLIEHAIRIQEHYIIVLTSILVTLSIIEITVIVRELQQRHKKTLFEQTLTIKLEKFIVKKRITNVKRIIEEFVSTHPEYKKNRCLIYRITCQIKQTLLDDEKMNP